MENVEKISRNTGSHYIFIIIIIYYKFYSMKYILIIEYTYLINLL